MSKPMFPADLYHYRPNSKCRFRDVGGFTLVELVVVIVILGVLAAFALPRFISLDASARIASIQALTGALRSAATQTYGLCMASASSGCSVSAGTWVGTINGRAYQLSMGYPDSGDNLNNNEIDAQLDYSGFTAQLTDWQTTTFVRPDAPTPANCSAAYIQANYFGSWVYKVTATTTGC